MGVFEIIKEVVKLAQKIDNVDLSRQILSLQTEIMGLLEENRILKEEIRSLREKSAIQGDLEFDGSNYYHYDPHGNTNGPYCQVCWDVDKRLVREIKGATPGTHFCVYCSSRRR